MATARSLVVSEGEVAAYHCIARCVRRAFLCGADPVTKRSFNHRKEWVRKRLESLAGAFAVDVGSYAVMSNHVHLALKTRPDVAKTWSPEEVTQRWRLAFPLLRRSTEAREALFKIEIADKKLVATRRMRLASVSWFMRCLCEMIARNANIEDQCKGRFWEGRFKCIALLDDAAVLACTAYIDLNPVRAGIAKTPEASRFTSIHDRIDQRRNPKSELLAPDGWLAPVSTKPKQGHGNRRVSPTPWLAMKFDDYLRLVDWTGRELRADKRGAIPADLAPILDRIAIKAGGWLGCVEHFGVMFKRAAGSTAKLEEHARKHNQKRLAGMSQCEAVFG